MSQATLVRWGNGQGIRLTKQVIEEAGLSVGDDVEVRVDGHRNIIITPAKHVRTIRVPDFAAMFEGYEGGPVHEDEAANPVGREAL